MSTGGLLPSGLGGDLLLPDSHCRESTSIAPMLISDIKTIRSVFSVSDVGEAFHESSRVCPAEITATLRPAPRLVSVTYPCNAGKNSRRYDSRRPSHHVNSGNRAEIHPEKWLSCFLRKLSNPD